MDPKDTAKYRGQVVELRFTNGARVRAHVLSVDVEVADNHLFYDYLETLDWDKTPPAPHLPREIIEKTSAKYVEAFERLTGQKLV